MRRIYGDFLGDLYTEELIETRSTYLSRTRMSAQLVSAGMWPPAEEQKWHPKYPWQPIPVNYEEKDEEDVILTFSLHRTLTKSVIYLLSIAVTKSNQLPLQKSRLSTPRRDSRSQ